MRPAKMTFCLHSSPQEHKIIAASRNGLIMYLASLMNLPQVLALIINLPHLLRPPPVPYSSSSFYLLFAFNDLICFRSSWLL